MNIRAHILLCMLVLGNDRVWSRTSDFFPPYSNSDYSCRCLPNFDGALYRSISSTNEGFVVHRHICELQTYLRSLQPHITFIAELLDGNTTDVADWFNRQAKSIRDTDESRGLIAWLRETAAVLLGQQTSLTHDLHAEISAFPFNEMIECVQSSAVKQALGLYKTSGTCEPLKVRWQSLIDFASNNDAAGLDQNFAEDIQAASATGLSEIDAKVHSAFVAAKDYANLCYVLHVFLAQRGMGYCAGESKDAASWIANTLGISQPNAVFNLYTIYDKVSSLPLEKTLASIANFIKSFKTALEKLQKEAATGFVGWLQNKWVLMPIAIGIIMVKTVQFFLSDSSGSVLSSNTSLNSTSLGNTSLPLYGSGRLLDYSQAEDGYV